LLTEIAKLDVDVQYLKRDLTESRTDIRDMRDRLARLEERVAHLPSKGFIVTVVLASLAIATSFLTLAPRLWNSSGVVPVTAPLPQSTPAAPT
jgi:hypothetical protein